MGHAPDEGRLHFGLNCANLLRNDDCTPADARCRVYVEQFQSPEWKWLESPTPVPVDKAATILGVSQEQLIDDAKAGRREYDYPKNVSRRVLVPGNRGSRPLTEKAAAKKLKISLEELSERIKKGEVKAEFLPEHMRVVLQTKWDYERCPLFEMGGICLYFREHSRRQINCLKEACEGNANAQPGLLF